MSQLILTTRVVEKDLATIRTLAREVGEMVGLEALQQTRFATAISEITRNAVQFANEGTVRFSVGEDVQGPSRQRLIAEVSDRGPGIADGAELGLASNGLRPAMGLVGSKRLVDRFSVAKRDGGGTVVQLEMLLPATAKRLLSSDLAVLAERLSARKYASPVDELNRQNHELLGALQQLRDKQSELEQADVRKNQFVATLAHELRGPLATLELSLELLRRKPDMSAVELIERREAMARQTAQMTKLVDELMDAARVSQGKVQLNKELTELNTLVSHSVEMSGGAIASKSHVLSVSLNDSPVWVLADRSRLTQVMCNLLQNAARYTPACGELAIEVRTESGWAIVAVTDNGIGISADLLPQIFGLFVQADNEGATAGGLGLGLTLVDRLVREHGGSVAAESEGAGKGSRFTVRLALAPQAAALP